MEFNCPECGRRLRAPDHLKNPLLRCRTCGAMFRAAEAVEQPPMVAATQEPLQTERAVHSQLEDLLNKKSTPAPPATRRAKGFGGKGWGIGTLVLLIVLSKAPRLLKKLFDQDRKPQPVPVQRNDEQLRAIKQAIERAKQQAEEQKAAASRREPIDEPQEAEEGTGPVSEHQVPGQGELGADAEIEPLPVSPPAEGVQ